MRTNEGEGPPVRGIKERAWLNFPFHESTLYDLCVPWAGTESHPIHTYFTHTIWTWLFFVPTHRMHLMLGLPSQ